MQDKIKVAVVQARQEVGAHQGVVGAVAGQVAVQSHFLEQQLKQVVQELDQVRQIVCQSGHANLGVSVKMENKRENVLILLVQNEKVSKEEYAQQTRLSH